MPDKYLDLLTVTEAARFAHVSDDAIPPQDRQRQPRGVPARARRTLADPAIQPGEGRVTADDIRAVCRQGVIDDHPETGAGLDQARKTGRWDAP
jgi:hypothetical protein